MDFGWRLYDFYGTNNSCRFHTYAYKMGMLNMEVEQGKLFQKEGVLCSCRIPFFSHENISMVYFSLDQSTPSLQSLIQ